MKTILFIVQKEFKQIFRNKGMLRLIFILPILQLLILSNAASFEVKNKLWVPIKMKPGSFEIFDIELTPSKIENNVQLYQVSRLALNYVQHCDGKEPAMRGKIRFNSSYPW